MAEQRSEGKNGEAEEEAEEKNENENENEKKKNADLELFTCLLQPVTADADAVYIGIRRLLLYRKAKAGVLRRRDRKCNGKGYVAFWESLPVPRLQSIPGNSGRWIPSPSPLSHWSDVDSVSSGQDPQSANPLSNRRTNFGSSASDNNRSYLQRVEPTYSFVGMYCIFDQCKAAVTVLKFGHMSTDLLAYEVSDGTLTVCTVSEKPSIIKQLNGHSKDVTDFDFSSNNHYIASSSLDKTVRVWEIAKCICIQGCVYSVNINTHTMMLSLSHRHRTGSRHKSRVTTVQYRSFSLLAGGPVLLTCTRDGNLSFFSY